MLYRVILTRNGEYKQTLHRSKTRPTAFINFRKIKEVSDRVIFERKYINYDGIIPAHYMIYVVKDHEPEDERRVFKDKNDVEYLEEPIFGIWTVLDSAPYRIEENFTVFGYDPRVDRKNFMEIVRIIMTDISKDKLTKEIVVVHNKLVIYNEDTFDMVICKCKRDAQRLHHTLYDATAALKLKNLLFLGTCTKSTIGFLYELIQENTGWSWTKVRRTTTRP